MDQKRNSPVTSPPAREFVSMRQGRGGTFEQLGEYLAKAVQLWGAT